MSSLGSFENPGSVAVVGASDDVSKWGYWVGRGALAGASQRKVYMVNRAADTVLGEKAYASLSDLPEIPELVVICVPARFVHAVVDEALERGTRAFLGITAGTPDTKGLRAKLRAKKARMIGPNSLGLYDSATTLQLAWGMFSRGHLAIVSQSGQLGSEIVKLAEHHGLGISRFISIGDQLDVTAAELLERLVADDNTQLVALYMESFSGGAVLVEVLRRLRQAGKLVLVLTTGASEASQRLAASHTGSITSALDTVRAACRAAGAALVSTPTRLVNAALLLREAPLPKGRRVALISDSGGQGGIAADVAAACGLKVPVLSSELRRKLSSLLPEAASAENPIDLAGAGEADLQTYAKLAEILLGSDEVDAVAFSGYLGCYGEDTPAIEAKEMAVADQLQKAALKAGKPLVVHSMSAASNVVKYMRANGVPTFHGIEFALGALAVGVDLCRWPGRELTSTTAATGGLPEPGYWGARKLLSELKIAAPEGRLVRSRADLALCADLTFPVVLKAGWLEHKSEHRGVVLNIPDMLTLEAAFDEMHGRLGGGDYVVEEQDGREHCIEMLIGAQRDPDFGPTVVVGAGGTQVELHRDVCIELAPVDHATAVDMIDRLRCRPLLAGWRGAPAVDVDGLARIVVAVSEAMASNISMSEFEVNPVRVAPDGALAVDALVVRSSSNQSMQLADVETE